MALLFIDLILSLYHMDLYPVRPRHALQVIIILIITLAILLHADRLYVMMMMNSRACCKFIIHTEGLASFILSSQHKDIIIWRSYRVSYCIPRVGLKGSVGGF